MFSATFPVVRVCRAQLHVQSVSDGIMGEVGFLGDDRRAAFAGDAVSLEEGRRFSLATLVIDQKGGIENFHAASGLLVLSAMG